MIPTLIFSTVYPQDLHSRRSKMNTVHFLDTFRGQPYELKIVCGSAHKESADEMNEVLGGGVHHFPLPEGSRYNSIRPHEIAYVKREVMREILKDDSVDYIYQVDSDVSLSFSHVARYLDILASRPHKCAIKFPYSLRHRRIAPRGQFGVCLLTRRSLSEAVLSWIYSTEFRSGKLYRRMAPDCGLKRWLEKENNTEVMLARDIYSVHWNEDGGWVYDKGKFPRELL